MGQSIHGFFQEPANRALIERLGKAGVELVNHEPAPVASDAFGNSTWVITGTLSQPRDEIAEMIIARGGKVSSSVSKKTTCLLAGDDAGSKLTKALGRSGLEPPPWCYLCERIERVEKGETV